MILTYAMLSKSKKKNKHTHTYTQIHRNDFVTIKFGSWQNIKLKHFKSWPKKPIV